MISIAQKLQNVGTLQVEYEGSIPFTRSDFVRYSTIFCDIARF